MVIVDANFLLLILDPDADVPTDPTTEKPLFRARSRIDHLIQTLGQAKDIIGLPTPVLAEILVGAGGAGPRYLQELQKTGRFRLLPFDVRAAVEVAGMTAVALAAGDKKGGSAASWQKVKYDRQILAIASVNAASALYTDDLDLRKLAGHLDMRTVSTWELPLPPEDTQLRLDV